MKRKIDPKALQRKAMSAIGEHLDSGLFGDSPPERAFIEWYALARFGKREGLNVVDCAGDGGIDAICEYRGTKYLIQSKYETSQRLKTVSRDEVSAFERLASRFLDSSRSLEFDQWLSTVQSPLRPGYRRLRAAVKRNPDSLVFVFITTKRAPHRESHLIGVHDVQQISSLWYLYSGLLTPSTERLDLTLHNAWHNPGANGEFETYVGLADAMDFIRQMDIDGDDRLFAQNVRTNLKSKVNSRIRITYEKEPDKFWLSNNGIYVVCSDVIARGDQYRLVFPSVINGAQTLYSIEDSTKRHPCNVLVRILKMDVGSNPTLLDSVVRRTNTQNTMKLTNLFAHDLVQLNIGRFLNDYRIFYERREREWANEKKYALLGYVPLGIKDVAQWLSVLRMDIGFGTARSNVADLFEPATYDRLFGAFGANMRSERYRQLGQVVFAGLLVRNLIRTLPKEEQGSARISQLLFVRFVYDAVNTRRALAPATEHSLKNHHLGRRSIPASLRAQYRTMLREMLIRQRKFQRSNPSSDFSNYYKDDKLTSGAFRAICTKTRARQFGNALLKAETTLR